jgi:hypothetical protein
MSIDENKETTDIMLPENLPLFKRIAAVKKRISEWIDTLGNNYDYNTDQIRLNRFEKRGNKYCYQYIIVRGVNNLKRNL